MLYLLRMPRDGRILQTIGQAESFCEKSRHEIVRMSRKEIFLV